MEYFGERQIELSKVVQILHRKTFAKLFCEGCRQLFQYLLSVVGTLCPALFFLHYAAAYLPIGIHHCLINCSVCFLAATSNQLLYFLNKMAGKPFANIYSYPLVHIS